MARASQASCEVDSNQSPQSPGWSQTSPTAGGERFRRVGSVQSLFSSSFNNLNHVSANVFGKRHSSEFRHVAIKNISFDDPDLLRGSCSADAMRSWGAVLNPNQGAGEWYSMSRRADHVDVFVSHNWSMSRLDKFLILALHLNMRVAVTSTVLLVVAVGPLTVAGILPVVVFADGRRMGPWCQVLGLAMFMFTLSCWQELCRRMPCRGRLLFLDRACIHQSNDALRQRGIEHLAAFVYYSWSFLICYSDEYLQKLWTVYEVASFMLLHPGSAMHVRHAWFTKFLIGGMVLTFFFNAAWHILYIPGILGDSSLPVETVGSLLTVSCLVPASVGMAFMVLKITEVRVTMGERVKSFRFDEAKCHNEDDRIVVQNNIMMFMKHHGHVDKNASDEDIMQEFEAMIQSGVPKLFAASLGPVGFPYNFATCMSLPYGLQCFDYFYASIRDGMPARTICLDVAYGMTIVCAVLPTCLAISFAFARKVAARHCRVGHTLSVCMLTALNVVFLGGVHTILNIFLKRAIEGSYVGIAVFCSTVVCLCVGALLCYRSYANEKYHRRLGAT